MKNSVKKGLNFGLTSGVITTLGLMVGLHSGTGSSMVILGGVLTIAIADSFSDALGIHVSEESISSNTQRDVWEATICTFLAKFVFTLSFAVPLLFLSLSWAIVVSIIWGFMLLSFVSYRIAKDQKNKHWKVIAEHLLIAVVVIISTHFVGDFIKQLFYK
jgi:VIT1/CCC1 family predicted Fe2+/Mn2+ transporter